MDKYDFFYNEKGGYSITKNDIVIDHVRSKELAELIARTSVLEVQMENVKSLVKKIYDEIEPIL